MSASIGAPAPSRRETYPTLLIFVLLLAFHFWATTANWRSTDLPGNGFRQTQTAITAMFVQRDHNFSVAYPTPVLGKPWSVPFEFPLYQWTVVAVSNLTHTALVPSGRAVSLICFYLTLPALWLLAGRLGVAGSRRLLVLAAVLSCPLYIFYARAFLIETMALMFSVWFLYAYVAAVERRHAGWLVVAIVAGVGAGLVKITTFILYLMPAAVWSLAWLWQAWRGPDGSRAVARVLGWIAMACALPFLASWGWVRYSDAVKVKNPSAVNLASGPMQGYNFGTWETRFSAEIWNFHWKILLTNLTPAIVLTAMILLTLLVARRWWTWTLWCVVFFMGVQVLFPVLYAWHEYYYVANTVLLMTAFALALCGLLESAHSRWIVWPVILGVFAAQIWTYFIYLRPEQIRRLDGGSGLTDVLRAITEPNDVLIIAGDDWASMTPFYSERRALMIRRSMEYDGKYLDKALALLKGEHVGALVLVGPQKLNHELCDRVGEQFGVASEPILHWGGTDVYVRRDARDATLAKLRAQRFDDVEIASATPDVSVGLLVKREVPIGEFSRRQREVFAGITPLPAKIYSEFGLSVNDEGGKWFMSAHPITRLWFDVTPGRHEITAEFKIAEGAYEHLRKADATDGVEFEIFELKSTGERVPLFTRYLNPASEPSDQGVQTLTLRPEISAGSQLLFETLPGKSYSRDWALWGPITIR